MRTYTTSEINQRFELLDRYERRCVLRYLQATETDHASVTELANHLHEQDPTPDTRDSVVISLHHDHLPKLAEADVVSLDADSETVRYDGDEFVEAHLELTPEQHASDA